MRLLAGKLWLLFLPLLTPDVEKVRGVITLLVSLSVKLFPLHASQRSHSARKRGRLARRQSVTIARTDGTTRQTSMICGRHRGVVGGGATLSGK